MSKEKLWKQEKGSIAVFAIATVFSLIFILGGVFAASTATRKNQLRTLLKIKEIYAQEIKVEKKDYIKTGLVLHYDGINNTGNGHNDATTKWADLSGNNNDGTLSTNLQTDTFYWGENNITLSGASSTLGAYINTPINLDGKERTILYTIDANNLTGSIWGDTDASNINGLFNYETFIANRGAGETQQNSYECTFAKSGIYHYAVTLSATELKFYSDGELVSTVNNTVGLKSTNNLRILAAYHASQNATNLKMYNFMVYDRSLTEEEVQQNYQVDKEKYQIKEKKEYQYTGSLQTFSVKKDGKYQIEAVGASGSGGNKYGQSLTAEGGNGAKIVATFDLKQGDNIDIVVGQRGSCTQATSADGTSGGGGGGTFLFKRISTVSDTRYQFTKGSINYETLLAVAGGSGSQDVGYKKVNSTGYAGQAASYKSPNNYTAYSTTTNAGTASTSVTGTMGISQFISYDAKGSFYTRNSGRAQGGYGCGGSQDDNFSYGGGWCNGTNTYQATSWSLDTTAVGTDGANRGNGYVIITLLESN